MRISLLLLCFLYTTLGFSQLAVESEYIVSGDVNDPTVGQKFTITNEGSEGVPFFWTLESDDDLPEEWVLSVCDAVICHPPGVESTPCDDSFTNYLDAGQSVNYFELKATTNGVAGEHTVRFKVSSLCEDFTDEQLIAETAITFSVAGGSNVEEKEIVQDLLIYPNPTVDRFQIKNDSDVSSIAVFNIVGKKLYSENHRPGQAHNISDLDNGFYLVRMLDRFDNTLKVVRITKD